MSPGPGRKAIRAKARASEPELSDSDKRRGPLDRDRNAAERGKLRAADNTRLLEHARELIMGGSAADTFALARRALCAVPVPPNRAERPS